jgi:hypothetical protein
MDSLCQEFINSLIPIVISIQDYFKVEDGFLKRAKLPGIKPLIRPEIKSFYGSGFFTKAC